MKFIALFAKIFYSDFLQPLQTVVDSIQKHGYGVAVYSSFYEEIKEKVQFDEAPVIFDDICDVAADLKCMFSFGGDGTILDSVSVIKDSAVPVLGFNFGRLGFLSMVSKEKAHYALEDFFSDNYEVEERSLIKIFCDEQNLSDNDYALNEISFLRNKPYSLINPKVWVNGLYLNKYWADGLIIATPTGSTAYSLSCGGPILYPSTKSFVISPIASHNLTACSIVIPDDSLIKVQVECREKEFCMNVDSFTRLLSIENTFTIKKNDFNFNLVRIKGGDFFSTIREKLNWGLDVRN